MVFSSLVYYGANILFSYFAKLPNNIDWAALYDEAIQQSVLPIVYSAVQDKLPTDMQSQWSDTFYQCIASNMRVNYEHSELHSLMSQAGIPYVILKGVASASYYPEPDKCLTSFNLIALWGMLTNIIDCGKIFNN
jgi:hypothetical protein